MKPTLALLLAIISATTSAADLPDRTLTPGALNPDVRQDNIQSTVCVKGFTKTIRPPASFTNKLKKRQLRQYGYSDTNPKHYEEDHLVPLSVGGHPTDPNNLWPQPRNSEWSAAKKDQLEFAMYKAVCRGDVTLEDARHAFATDWIAAYKHYGNLLGKYGHGRVE
ncbi:MAG: hypothetical protein WCV99_21485 [Sterolibacterium sp.]|jgi:hypothetical protein